MRANTPVFLKVIVCAGFGFILSSELVSIMEAGPLARSVFMAGYCATFFILIDEPIQTKIKKVHYSIIASVLCAIALTVGFYLINYVAIEKMGNAYSVAPTGSISDYAFIIPIAAHGILVYFILNKLNKYNKK